MNYTKYILKKQFGSLTKQIMKNNLKKIQYQNSVKSLSNGPLKFKETPQNKEKNKENEPIFQKKIKLNYEDKIIIISGLTLSLSIYISVTNIV